MPLILPLFTAIAGAGFHSLTKPADFKLASSGDSAIIQPLRPKRGRTAQAQRTEILRM